MGILDFLKKKIGELKSEKPEILEQEPEEKRNLKFNELEEWLAEKRKENARNEERTVREIAIIISELIEELKEENEELKKVDLKNRKEEQRIKNIVFENLSNYSSHLSKLIDNLEALEKKGLQKLVSDINKIFLEFKQKSNLSFEKATFLVGRELEKVKESIRRFFERIKEVEEQNKDIFQNLKIIVLVEQKIQEIKRLENSKIEISVELKEIEKKILRAETEEKIIKDDIKKIKNSEEYLAWEKRRQESSLKKKEIEREIFEVKNMLDWKNLTKIFHINEKKMTIIKEYESHFSQILEKDNEKKLMDILQESNMDTVAISRKITEIKSKKEEVSEILKEKNKLEELASEIMSIRADIKNFLSEKDKISKRFQKVEDNITEIKNDVNGELKKLGISLNIE